MPNDKHFICVPLDDYARFLKREIRKRNRTIALCKCGLALTSFSAIIAGYALYLTIKDQREKDKESDEIC